MKNILVGMMLFCLATSSVLAQGTIYFNTFFTNSVGTNAVAYGPATGLTGTAPGQYFYALFYSQTVSSVNGETAAISGYDEFDDGFGYAFNSSQWTLAAYGTNALVAGKFLSTSADSGDNTVVPGLAGGATAYFVVVGWSANIGTNIAAVQNWFGDGNPVGAGWIGQSAVSGLLTLGSGSGNPFPPFSPEVFGLRPPQIQQAFSLGLAGNVVRPFITSQPSNVTVSAGVNASFSVLAGGSPVPVYQWSLSGTNIQGATNDTLTVTNAQVNNAGSYSVFISNFAGTTNSSAAVLAIQGTEPIITSQPGNLIVPAGGNASFTVGVTGSAPLNYQWSFNNTNLVGATNASLTLSGVQANNSGSYAVAITNSYGATNSSAAVLTVQGTQPVITSQPANLFVPAGSNASFMVGATGSAPLNYQWSFNDTNLAGATNASLTLAGVQTNNSGSYAVAITNSFGKTNSFAVTLTVTTGQNPGYLGFGNNPVSATKIFTNSSVDGAITGLTTTNGGFYYYALFASSFATNVNGQTSAIAGNASSNYAFNDTNWTLVAYGTNGLKWAGELLSASKDGTGYTPVSGFTPGTTAQFVVVGWSANVGTDIASVQEWFGFGDPVFDGWIGQSAVSGPIMLGGGPYPIPFLFNLNAPFLQGFTLGLASPNPTASYAVPVMPPAIIRTVLSGGSLQLSWSAAAGSYGVQSGSSPTGPWSDTGLTVTTAGTNSVVIAPIGTGPFFRLITQ